MGRRIRRERKRNSKKREEEKEKYYVNLGERRTGGRGGDRKQNEVRGTRKKRKERKDRRKKARKTKGREEEVEIRHNFQKEKKEGKRRIRS